MLWSVFEMTPVTPDAGSEALQNTSVERLNGVTEGFGRGLGQTSWQGAHIHENKAHMTGKSSSPGAL